MRTAEINGQIYANVEDLKEEIRDHAETIEKSKCISKKENMDMYRMAHDHIIWMIEGQTTDCATIECTAWRTKAWRTKDCFTASAEPATEEDREKLKKLFQDPLPVEIDITEQDQRQLAASIVSTMPRIMETMADALPRLIDVAIEAIEKMPPEELIRIATERKEESE